MGSSKNSGFTIIETMLFLAISTALMVAILIGSNGPINEQRYRDGVDSLKSYVQDQYSFTANTSNARTGTESCVGNPAAGPSGPLAVSPAGGQAPGTSDCLLLGRYVEMADDGKTLTASDVLGYQVSSTQRATDVDDLMLNYSLALSSIGQETYMVPWDMQVVQDTNPSNAKKFSIMIVRSPRSGSTLTFTTASNSVSPNAIRSVANNTTPLHMCLGGNGNLFSGVRKEVRINGRASNQGAVEVPIESDSICK